MLNLSPLLDMLLNGELAELEKGVVPFEIAEELFQELFMLVDGIYPKYSRFVKAFKEPIGDEEKALTSWQESARKDIERAFSVLQGKFQVLARPVVIRDLKLIEEVVTCCLILHNMCVADRIVDQDPRAKYDPSNSLDANHAEDSVEYSAEFQDMTKVSAAPIGIRNAEESVRILLTRKRRWMTLVNRKEHARLHNALKVYLGRKYKKQKQKSNNKRRKHGNS